MELKIIVTGYAQHGKDTTCEFLADKGYKFRSSSDIANEKVVFPVLSKKYGYKTLEECHKDRVNHRSEWYDLIVEYNTPDLTRLAKDIFAENNIYCGLRNINELRAMKRENLVDFIIWVDASKRKPKENSSSMTISKENCDYIVNNNGNKLELFLEVNTLLRHLKYLERKKWESWRKPKCKLKF